MIDRLQQLPPKAAAAGDVLFITLGMATLAKWLPPIAAALTIVWTCLRIYESVIRIRKLHRGEDVRRD